MGTRDGRATGFAAAAWLAAVALVGCTSAPPGSASPEPVLPSPGASAVASAVAPTASPSPSPTPERTPVLVPSALTGLLVDPAAAAYHPIAVMIDDLVDARPQAGFNAASVVWQAPAEGGIPRYMLIFQDTIPTLVGPVRSAREYYIEWAAEWRAMYVHAGGSPQALDSLFNHGRGAWVWNADYMRWGGTYLWRTKDRIAPHNVYTDGEHLRELAARLGAADGPLTPAWTFTAAATPADARPSGGTIQVRYPYEWITYHYDPATNRYHRYLNDDATPQVDAADGAVVAPANVVVLRMAFGPLTNGGGHGRLEASDVGSGVAWIATNGRTVKGRWSKASVTAPTLLFGPDGAPFPLTPGQTFVQVLPLDWGLTIKDGTVGPTTDYGDLRTTE